MNNMQFNDFRFPVDESGFTVPHRPMEEVRLVVVDKASGSIRHDMFSNLAAYLQDDLVVINDVGISRSRLRGFTGDGLAIDICFLLQDRHDDRLWEAVILAERFPPDQGNFTLADGRVRGNLLGKVAPFDGAYWIVRNRYQGYRGRISIDLSPNELRTLLDSGGTYMHPWYTDINTLPEAILNPGVAVNPGGALLSEPSRRMTPDLLDRCTGGGERLARVSINLAFAWRPANADDSLDDYRMNSEQIRVGADAVDRIRQAIDQGRRIIPVGTGPARVLESMDVPPQSVERLTDIFISPGFSFRYCSGLLTNLHVPMSTHVIMACAFGGRDLVISACEEASANSYAFGIHGDAMLVLGDHKPLACSALVS